MKVQLIDVANGSKAVYVTELIREGGAIVGFRVGEAGSAIALNAEALDSVKAIALGGGDIGFRAELSEKSKKRS